MVNICNSCSKSILNYQQRILCRSCNLYYHTRCIYTDTSKHLNWFCFKCTGELFAFNHYVDDDEFKFAIYNYGSSVSYNRMLSLKLNPFGFEMIENARNEDNLINHTVDNKCSYIFDNMYTSSSDSDEFSILHINPRSLNKNIEDIHAFISGLNITFKIIAMSETWFNDDNSNLINFENYVLISNPRFGRKSGGSAIYIHNSVSYKDRSDLKLIAEPTSNNDHSESTFIEITNAAEKT